MIIRNLRGDGWVGQIYHSSSGGKARGAGILLHKSVPFVHSTIISDSNGRFVIVTGQIHNTRVALVNVYAPNCDDDAFFKRLFLMIPDMSSHFLILGGDFNGWLNPRLDRSSAKVCMPSRSARVIQSLMKEFVVSDACRFFNPYKKGNNFFFRMFIISALIFSWLITDYSLLCPHVNMMPLSYLITLRYLWIYIFKTVLLHVAMAS